MTLLLRLAIVVGVAVAGFAQGQPLGMLVQGTITRNAMYLRLFQEIAHFEAQADGREATGATAAVLRTYQRQRLGLSEGEAAQLRAAAVDCVGQLRTEGLLDSQRVSRGADDLGMIRAAMIRARVLSAVDALAAAMGAESFARLDGQVMQYLSTPVVLTSSPTGAGAAGGNLRSARSKGGAVTMSLAEGCSDPTPEIIGITPGSISDPWQAGGLQEFAISGTGFGIAPTITVSGDVGSYGVYPGSDTSISAWVDLTSSMGGTASVSVTSHGYTGNGFIEGSEHNSPTGQPESVQIAAPPPACPYPASEVSEKGNWCSSCVGGTFTARLKDAGGVTPPNGKYQGRTVRERLSSLVDTCHFDGSRYSAALPPPEQLGDWPVGSLNAYGSDLIGFPLDASGYFQNEVRNGRYTSCYISVQQNMQIDRCGISEWADYETHDTRNTITASGMEAIRGNEKTNGPIGDQ